MYIRWAHIWASFVTENSRNRPIWSHWLRLSKGHIYVVFLIEDFTIGKICNKSLKSMRPIEPNLFEKIKKTKKVRTEGDDRCKWTEGPVWPYLAKFCHFGETISLWQFLHVYLIFGKIVNLLWPTFMLLGKSSLLQRVKYCKNNLAISSHWEGESSQW